jgi:hypothetical protein
VFIVGAREGSQAPLGAAWKTRMAIQEVVPLLTELESNEDGSRSYKPGAPNGAIMPTPHCTTLCLNLLFFKEHLVAALPRCEISGLVPHPPRQGWRNSGDRPEAER